MKLDIAKHPCFNKEMHHKFGRIHLPVAPRCNIQCNYCSRDFDCVNESRPGVTSSLLTPKEALVYLDNMLEKMPNISVVGIAGPGDPFANPEETMETLRLVREKYPEMLLCVATNGLNLLSYVDELAELEISHVTVTINAIDPEIGKKVYSWIRHNKRVTSGYDSAATLISNQLEAVKRLAEKDVVVKVNSVVVPGVNDDHIIEIVKKAKELGATISNCIPMYPTKGTKFEDVNAPTAKFMNDLKDSAIEFLPQMRHCARCRADAAGIIGKDDPKLVAANIKKAKCMSAEMEEKATTEYASGNIAVASIEGMLVNQHLGEAQNVRVYNKTDNGYEFLEERSLPARGTDDRWEVLSEKIKDCKTLLVNGVGETPKGILEKNGINVFVVEGMIDEALSMISENKPLKFFVKREKTVCGSECMGSGTGCG